MTESWKLSEEQRRAVLLLEVAGLLHDLGKLSNGFIAREAMDNASRPKAPYDYEFLADPLVVFKSANQNGQGAPEAIKAMKRKASDTNHGAPFKDRPDLTAILEGQTLKAWDGAEYSLAELMLLSEPQRLKTKNWHTALGRNMQPGLLIGYLHGIAHYEKEDANAKQAYDDTFSATPFGNEKHVLVDCPGSDLTAALTRIPLDRMSQVLIDKRRKWLFEIEKPMRQGIAETRRPTNEVTLWDWGSTVAALTKAAAAWIFRHGWPDDLGKLDELAWRTLRINLDKVGAYSRADRISDLLGVREALDRSYQQVQVLLEEEHGFANLFFHDETGAYYLFPDFVLDDDLRRAIQECFSPDLKPHVYLEEPVMARDLDPRSPSYDPEAIRKLVAGPRAHFIDMQGADISAENDPDMWNTIWIDERPRNAETCTVCGLRPAGYPPQGSASESKLNLRRWANEKKAAERHLCRVCLDRRDRRSEKWATEELHGTIWTDEVADENGRLALFVGRLGLDGWLNGRLLQTLVVNPNTGSTKTPSPARLHRIAETARSFWQAVTDETIPDVTGHRPYRLALYPDNRNLPNLGEQLGSFHTYELDVDGLTLGVVWDPPNSRFLTAENLAYFAKRWGRAMDELSGYLEGKNLRLLEPSAYRQASQEITIVRIVRSERLDGYEPAIPLMAEPSTCMALVPADKALGLVHRVKGNYAAQMGRVQDRLPLHIGLVFFPRMTPIRAVLESGRAMLEMPDKWEQWDINASGRQAHFCRADQRFEWHYPEKMGDGQTNDIWYPHLLTVNPTQHAELDRAAGHFQLVDNLTGFVYILPGRFDFEFLDTTGRRFEIHYGPDGRRPLRRTRPFLLEDLDRFAEIWGAMEHLKISQRHQVIHTIEATRETWYGQDPQGTSWQDPVFERFVRDTLAGATWINYPWNKIASELQAKLVRAGVTGELADLAELHMEILKEHKEAE